MIASLADGLSERASERTSDEDQVPLPVYLRASPLLCKQALAFKTAGYADYFNDEMK